MAVFIDSGAFIAHYNARDEFHGIALELFKHVLAGEFGNAMTSDYVFDEAVTRTAVQLGHERAVELGNKISASFDIVHVDEIIFNLAWKKFTRLKPFSFTDCTNLAIMERNSIKDIFTFDRAFRNFAKVIGGK